MEIVKQDDWIEDGKKRFGEDMLQWKFKCPKCKTTQTPQDLIDAGVKREDVDKYIGFSCIGRFTESKGCDWSLGGLFRIHTLEVDIDGHNRPVFEFAD